MTGAITAHKGRRDLLGAMARKQRLDHAALVIGQRVAQDRIGEKPLLVPLQHVIRRGRPFPFGVDAGVLEQPLGRLRAWRGTITTLTPLRPARPVRPLRCSSVSRFLGMSA